MKIRPLFDKYQKYLVAFANSKIGRLYLHAENLPVIKVTPDGLHYAQEIKNNKVTKARAVFYSRSPYLKKFDLALTALEIASESFDFLKSFNKPEQIITHFLGIDTIRSLPMVMMDTGIFYPDANPETTSVDGLLETFKLAGDETWANFRNGTGTVTLNAFPDVVGRGYGAGLFSAGTANKWQEMNRSVFLFDTSSLTSGATISSATFSFYGYDDSFDGIFDVGTNAQKAIALVDSSPASNTALSSSDWTNVGTTRYASDLAHTSYQAAAYNDMALNATGLAAISKTGITKFGTRTGADCDNSEPTWGSFKTIGWGHTYADNGSNKPKLTITYIPAPSGGFPIFFGNTAIA